MEAGAEERSDDGVHDPIQNPHRGPSLLGLLREGFFQGSHVGDDDGAAFANEDGGDE
jgi:hypothetical protein